MEVVQAQVSCKLFKKIPRVKYSITYFFIRFTTCILDFRSFLQQLTETVVPHATVFGFMDFDPYSICIFKGIKYGFKTQAFRLTFTKCLKMNCLGVDSSDLDSLKKYLMPMDTKCIAKAENLLKEGHLDDYMKKNLQVMIERKERVDFECVPHLSSYVRDKISSWCQT